MKGRGSNVCQDENQLENRYESLYSYFTMRMKRKTELMFD